MEKFSRKKRIMVIGAIIICLLGLNLFTKELKNFFYLFSAPFQKSLFITGKKITDFVGFLSVAWELEKEVKHLLKENQTLRNEITSLKEFKSENELLRAALGLEQEGFQVLPAEVVFRNVSNSFIVINKGKRDNISEGMTVITSQKELLGRVEETFEDFSRINLITQKGFSFPAKIQSKEFTALIKGEGNDGLSFDLVPREEKLDVGQEIITVALGGVFPKGLFVGEIEAIEKSDLIPYQKAKVKPFFNLNELNSVLIIVNFSPLPSGY